VENIQYENSCFEFVRLLICLCGKALTILVVDVDGLLYLKSTMKTGRNKRLCRELELEEFVACSSGIHTSSVYNLMTSANEGSMSITPFLLA
jgi:hypothetical protein